MRIDLPTTFVPPKAANEDVEHRDSARSPLFTVLQCGDGRAPMWAVDIGLGGLRCVTKAARFPGTLLDLHMEIPQTGKFLTVGGMVLTMDEAPHHQVALGIKFCRLTQGSKLELYRFLDQRRKLWEAHYRSAAKKRQWERHMRIEEMGGPSGNPFARMVHQAISALKVKREVAIFRHAPPPAQNRDLEFQLPPRVIRA